MFVLSCLLSCARCCCLCLIVVVLDVVLCRVSIVLWCSCLLYDTCGLMDDGWCWLCFCVVFVCGCWKVLVVFFFRWCVVARCSFVFVVSFVSSFLLLLLCVVACWC